MTRFNGIHHTALVTADMEATIRFWRDLLELPLAGGLGSHGYRQYFFAVSDNNLLAFFSWDGAQPVPEKEAGRAVSGPRSFDHICLEVKDKHHLWELKDRLDAADIWVSEVLDNGFIYSVFTFDPNGISVELCCRSPREDLRNNPRLVDTEPPGAAMEGPDPQPSRWPPVKIPTPPDERPVYPGELGKLLDGSDRWTRSRGDSEDSAS